MKECNEKIDLVITWVDGNDPMWLKEKAKFLNKDFDENEYISGANRFEDQGLLKYWFRGIEKYMPWVNNIFFVTCGHYPEWLNLENPRLHFVKHSDFIPNEFLPTFNSNAILLNLHRIPNLGEKFIYFNDDMYVINDCSKDKFFRKGLPADMGVLDLVSAPNTDPFWDMMLNNVMVINHNFNKKQSIKKNFCKWYSLKYSFKNRIKNLSLSNFNYFPGFHDVHLPNPFLKNTFTEVWSKNEDICTSTCLHKFRSCEDITEWTMRYWQLAKGEFVPINKEKLGRYVSLKNSSGIKYLKTNPKKPLVCLNDSADNYDEIIKYFEGKFPKKSSFEK